MRYAKPQQRLAAEAKTDEYEERLRRAMQSCWSRLAISWHSAKSVCAGSPYESWRAATAAF